MMGGERCQNRANQYRGKGSGQDFKLAVSFMLAWPYLDVLSRKTFPGNRREAAVTSNLSSAEDAVDA